MSERATMVLCVGLAGAALTFARRYKNSDPDAGVGVAFWTIVIILLSV